MEQIQAGPEQNAMRRPPRSPSNNRSDHKDQSWTPPGENQKATEADERDISPAVSHTYETLSGNREDSLAEPVEENHAMGETIESLEKYTVGVGASEEGKEMHETGETW